MDELPDLLPVGQEKMNSYLPRRKILLLGLDDRMALFSSPVTLYIYITRLIFSDENA